MTGGPDLHHSRDPESLRERWQRAHEYPRGFGARRAATIPVYTAIAERVQRWKEKGPAMEFEQVDISSLSEAAAATGQGGRMWNRIQALGGAYN